MAGEPLLRTYVDFEGPFFRKDPAKTIRANTRALLIDVAEEGERAVQALSKARTGAFRRGVRGRAESQRGRPWSYTAVISATHVYPWPGGGPKRYRGGKLEQRDHMFRTVARRLRSSARVLRANLTKGFE